MKREYDPLSHTKLHEIEALVRVISCDFVDRLTVLNRLSPPYGKYFKVGQR